MNGSGVLIVDASVAAKWFFREPDSDVALQLLSRVAKHEFVLAAPDLLLYELGSVIQKRIRASQIDRIIGHELMRSVLRAPVKLIEPDVFIEAAFYMASHIGMTMYDAAYVALATEMRTRVVTADERLVNTCRHTPWEDHVALLTAYAL